MAATLTDQLGAMALVDELRHRQMVVNEHLDLPRRRAEVAQRLRGWYESQHLQVDDALIAAGVQAYFDRRLTFMPGKTGWLEGLFAQAYIARERHAHLYRRGLAAAAVAVALVAGTAYVRNYLLHAEARDHVAALTSALEAVRTSHGEVSSRVAVLHEKAAARPEVQGTAAPLDGARAALDKAAPQLHATAPDPGSITRASRDAFLRDVDAKQAAAATQATLLDNSKARLDKLAKLLGAYEKLAALRLKYPDPALWEAARITQLVRDLRNDFSRGDDDAGDNADRHVRALNAWLTTAAGQQSQLQDLRATLAELGKLGLTAAERQRLAALLQSAVAASRKLEGEQVKTLAQEAEQLLAFARQPLTVQVVDRQGERSGVERNFNGSGGKSWYLIVEALDANGSRIPMPVRSAETGATKTVGIYGVRVSRDEYQRVKMQKQASGHVESRDMGQKPAGSLTVRYARTLSATPDMITEW